MDACRKVCLLDEILEPFGFCYTVNASLTAGIDSILAFPKFNSVGVILVIKENRHQDSKPDEAVQK